jgi:hypothetical protein
MVLFKSASMPTPVLPLPAVLLSSALIPTAVFSVPVALLKRALSPDGGVELACCVGKERKRSIGSIICPGGVV